MFIRIFFKFIVKIFYREIIVKGLENLPDSSQVIFTPNHPNSLMDPLLLSFLPSRYQIHFVAKAPLFNIPLLGWLMRKMGAIPVIRKFEADGEVDYSAFFKSCVDSLASGESITIFPEGVSLSQPRMSVMKTGAARLFFLSKEKDINIHIVPIGLNYEYAPVFRSSVVMWISKPPETDDVIKKYKNSPKDAVLELTDRIGKALEECVFQSENFHDRELMLYLDRIYSEDKTSESWVRRLKRLKQFEAGFNALRDCCDNEIDRLRLMLLRHKKLAQLLKTTDYSSSDNILQLLKRFLLVLIGFPFASIGWLFNVIPYQLCNFIVIHIKKYEIATTATYKVTYSLFLYPVFYLIEGILLYKYFGWNVLLLFVILILPISYFTLYYMEWIYEGGWGIPVLFRKLRKTFRRRITHLLEKQERRIKDLIDELAERLDTQN